MATYYTSSSAPGGGSGAIGSPWTLAEAVAGVAAGDTVIVKNDGTYTRSATLTLSTSGSSGAAPITFIGGNSSGVVDGSKPIIQAAANSITLLKTTGLWLVVQNLTFDGNSGGGFTAVRGYEGGSVLTRAYNCEARNCTNRGFYQGAAGADVIRCYATGCSTQPAFESVMNGLAFWGCEARSNSATGFKLTNDAAIVQCLSANNSGASSDGYEIFARGLAIGCTSYGNGRHGFNLTTAQNAQFFSCLAYGNGGYGFSADASLAMCRVENCAGGNNTSGNVNANLTSTTGFVTLTANPFTNAGSNDFSLNTTAGGGAACRAAGLPALFPGGLTTGHADVGAVQHADPAGGGLIGGGGLNGGLQ